MKSRNLIKKTRNRKGVFFTLAVILLLIPLIFLVSFYTGTSKTKIEDTTAKIRCDELHYFVEDVKRDMSRAGVIFGRRAAIYAIDYVVTPPGNPMLNYTFNCSSACKVDCNKVIYPKTGSEAAIAELTLCGTLNGTNATYMINHTLGKWIDMMERRGEDMNFQVNITLNEIKVVPADAWHFSVIIDNTVDIIDNTGICYYRESTARTMSNTSIIGLEDPLYTLNTEGKIINYIYDCDIVLDMETVAGCSKSDLGNGTIEGTTLLYHSNIGNINDLRDYCDNTSQEILGQQIFILDKAGGIACNSGAWQSCLNASHSKHFAGVIDYFPSATCGTCPPTIPYICDTGEMDNEPPFGGGARAPGCDEADISNGTCVYIKNDGTSHQVLMGINSENISVLCYQASNISKYETNCTLNYSNGPSFFDRLDGSYNLSEKYVNQSMEYFNNSLIGIETLVGVYELMNYSITPHENATWIDYLYWQNVNGSEICGICGMETYPARIDCQHSIRYGKDTGC